MGWDLRRFEVVQDEGSYASSFCDSLTLARNSGLFFIVRDGWFLCTAFREIEMKGQSHQAGDCPACSARLTKPTSLTSMNSLLVPGRRSVCGEASVSVCGGPTLLLRKQS